jgi:NTP pyrophosphatase (non-canonical NTP hydrolase)
MITKDVFDRIDSVYQRNKEKITSADIMFALTEELGEYSRAVRVEDKAIICSHKTVKEHSTIEIIDLILVAIEAYISRGGKYEDIEKIANQKLEKWEDSWNKENETIRLGELLAP